VVHSFFSFYFSCTACKPACRPISLFHPIGPTNQLPPRTRYAPTWDNLMATAYPPCSVGLNATACPSSLATAPPLQPRLSPSVTWCAAPGDPSPQDSLPIPLRSQRIQETVLFPNQNRNKFDQSLDSLSNPTPGDRDNPPHELGTSSPIKGLSRCPDGNFSPPPP
jgi:hypothetical protein